MDYGHPNVGTKFRYVINTISLIIGETKLFKKFVDTAYCFDDFIKYRGEQGAKDAGKWRLEGKEYIVQDGDVIHFRFNV